MYGKLFAQMYDGTLATRGPWQAMVTFQQMIILADRAGIVDMTREAIARRTTIPIEIINVGITALEQPDNESRTPAENGRRIVRLSTERDWGWQLVNYEQYRNIRSQEERREYMRLYQAKRRAASKQDVNNVSNVNQSSKQEAVSSMQEEEQLLASRDQQPSRSTGTAIPLVGGKHWAVDPKFLAELELAYPAVDGPATLLEIRAWCLSNPMKCKTERGIRRFINRWFERTQNA